MPSAWNHRAWGSLPDPIHKSQVTRIVGDYGCPRSFAYEMNARDIAADETQSVSGKAALGTATHEVLARVLTTPTAAAAVLAGRTVPRERIETAMREEYAREVGGREPRWYKGEDVDDELHARVDMVVGVLRALPDYVAEVVLVEAGFIAPLGDYWLSGHVDLLYRPRAKPTTFALADWKTGAAKPGHIELDHGWEAGIYSAAVLHGMWLPRHVVQSATGSDGKTSAQCGERVATHWSRYIAERRAMEAALIDLGAEMARGVEPPDDAVSFGEFPSEIHHVHLADYVPYKKAGVKAVKRAEDLRHYKLDAPAARHKYSAGEMRGPAWLSVQLSEHDMPRTLARLKSIVGMIRMGWFVDQVGERCGRCAYARDCLTSGYGPTGTAKAALERSLARTDTSDADAAALSVDDDE